MMDDFITLKKYGKTFKVRPVFSNYMVNSGLALTLIGYDHIPFGTVTVNLIDEVLTDDFCAFIDTNNMGLEIVEWLEKNDFGERTGKIGCSGFCSYPEFRFNPVIVKLYKLEEG